jgi:hypothetical protein
MGRFGPSPHAKFKTRLACLQLVMPGPLKLCLFWCGPSDPSVRAAWVCRPALNSIRLRRDAPGGRNSLLPAAEAWAVFSNRPKV